MLKMDPRNIKPRRGSIIYKYKDSVYYAVKSDVETFLKKFIKEESLNYSNFANVWQALNFTFIFSDQNYMKPLNILCDICFTVVKKYIMFQSDLHIRVGAFYLLYGLYYKQPIQNFMKIRLSLEEYKKVKDLMMELQDKGQLDALYIFAKMKSDDAFVYVAQPKPLSLSKRPEEEFEADDTFKSGVTESSLSKFEDILKDEMVQALDKTCKSYEEKLAEFAKQNDGLVPFKTTIIRDLEEAYKNVFNKESNVSEQAQPETSSNVYSRRQLIKKKALANKKAQYRGSKKVITGIDMCKIDDSD